jgi:glycosyltransferase involved in cell wall biosynthesis
LVVPTRNRRAQLLRFLDLLDRQSLAPSSFEVVVVDDGSTPPLVEAELVGGRAHAVRLIRRDPGGSAHDSRAAGAEAALGDRVLFLDDDVDPDPDVLSAHAAVPEGFAVGRILYHAEAGGTPYLRFQTYCYAVAAQGLIDRGSTMPLDEIYICNSSGPRAEFARALEAVRSLHGPGPVPGDGCDEELLDVVLRHAPGGTATVLPGAVVWHRDTKTVRQACEERRRHGETLGKLLIERPELRSHFREPRAITGRLGWLRAARIRLLFAAPRIHRAVSDVCAFVADEGPPQWVSSKFCYPPLAIAFWEGFRKAEPSFKRLRDVLSREAA